MKSGGIKFSNTQQLITLLCIAIALNANTLFHAYALDDIVVLTENRFVAAGIKGIPEILTTDYISGYSTAENVLTGVRYRPFSLVLFAIEYQFFGANPLLSHLFNILLFALLITLLYKLLRTYVFREKHEMLAFLTCLLFVVHPIHTEVIANVKSRDELITFIFLLVSVIALIKYIEKRKSGQLFSSMVCFFLALLTKESAVTFIGVVPLLLYFFYQQPVKKSLQSTIPLILVFVGYMLLRFLIVGFNYYPVNDVTNAPYIYATSSEAFATKVFILFKYLWLLVYPHPLSTDYGYNQIPYIQLNSIQFIFSALVLFSLIAYALYAFKVKSLYSFCILYFLVTISVGTNFVVDLGTTMAERMLFQPSLAFCIAVAFLYLKVRSNSKLLSGLLLLTLLIFFSIKTVARNSVWKNNETLFFTDVISSPNSARINLFAAESYIIKANKESNQNLKNEYLQRAVYYGERSLKIHPKFAYTYLRLGFAYYHLFNYFKAADLWIQAKQLEPTDPETIKWTEYLSTLFYKQGNGFSERENFNEAIKYYRKAIELNNNNVEAWYNLGGIYFLQSDTIEARDAWNHVKKMDPNHPFAK